MSDYWKLAGPAAFVGTVVEEVRAGNSVVVLTPLNDKRDVVRQIGSILREEGYDANNVDELSESVPIRVGISNALKIERDESGRKAHLFASPEFRRPQIITSRPDESAWPAWHEFLLHFESEAKSWDVFERPCFLLQLPRSSDAFGEQFGCSQLIRFHQLDGINGEVDTTLHVASRLSGRDLRPLQRKLVTSWITQLALWDLELADVLLPLSVHQLADPTGALQEYASDRHWHERKQPSWWDGTLGLYEGAKRRHSAWLAVHGPRAELLQREWAAQATVLLPLLDQHRRSLIQLAAPYMTTTKDEDLWDMEFANVHESLMRVRAPKALIRQARKLRVMRNMLAHFEVVRLDEIFHSALLDPPSEV